MQSDLDRLMAERGIEALVVSNHEMTHPSFRWITRGAKVTRGYAIKKSGSEPLLVHYPMERDEAAAVGLPTRSVHEFGFSTIFAAEKSIPKAYAELFGRIFDELGIRGPIAFTGAVPIHLYVDLLDELARRGQTIFRSGGEDVIQIARKRKDASELELIASVGRRTEEVVACVRDLLREATIDGGVAGHHGKALRIGDLKDLVSSEISRRGMIEDHETILSQGRDAAIPHSRGEASAPLRASLPIVLDIFPRDRDNGYFFDYTRTFAIGPVSDELRRTHALVLEAFERAEENMRAGQKASESQKLVCDFFEKNGYATTRSNPTTTDGYVHSLGHGVGLDVHERPSFHLMESNTDVIEVGDVLTIEPGLYFPDREIGVRIEETFFIAEDGRPHSFCNSDRGLEP
jgi:Xaa-Pro aminopeptidase